MDPVSKKKRIKWDNEKKPKQLNSWSMPYTNNLKENIPMICCNSWVINQLGEKYGPFSHTYGWIRCTKHINNVKLHSNNIYDYCSFHIEHLVYHLFWLYHLYTLTYVLHTTSYTTCNSLVILLLFTWEYGHHFIIVETFDGNLTHGCIMEVEFDQSSQFIHYD